MKRSLFTLALALSLAGCAGLGDSGPSVYQQRIDELTRRVDDAREREREVERAVEAGKATTADLLDATRKHKDALDDLAHAERYRPQSEPVGSEPWWITALAIAAGAFTGGTGAHAVRGVYRAIADAREKK